MVCSASSVRLHHSSTNVGVAARRSFAGHGQLRVYRTFCKALVNHEVGVERRRPRSRMGACHRGESAWLQRGSREQTARGAAVSGGRRPSRRETEGAAGLAAAYRKGGRGRCWSRGSSAGTSRRRPQAGPTPSRERDALMRRPRWSLPITEGRPGEPTPPVYQFARRGREVDVTGRISRHPTGSRSTLPAANSRRL